MKYLSRALFLLFLLAGVLIAVSNPQPVQLALWPLPHVAVVPLYLLVIVLLLVGVLVGLGLGWWAGRHHRRRARKHGGEAARLEREVVRNLRDGPGRPPGRRRRPTEASAARATRDRAADRAGCTGAFQGMRILSADEVDGALDDVALIDRIEGAVQGPAARRRCVIITSWPRACCC